MHYFLFELWKLETVHFLGFYFEFDMEVKDLTMVTLGFIALLLFSFSFALVIAVVNAFVDSVGKLIGFLLTERFIRMVLMSLNGVILLFLKTRFL